MDLGLFIEKIKIGISLIFNDLCIYKKEVDNFSGKRREWWEKVDEREKNGDVKVRNFEIIIFLKRGGNFRTKER